MNDDLLAQLLGPNVPCAPTHAAAALHRDSITVLYSSPPLPHSCHILLLGGYCAVQCSVVHTMICFQMKNEV